MNDHIDEIDVNAAIATVSDQRREYALRYRKEHDRRLAIAVYQLLCHGLKAEYGIEELPVFEFGHHGKPFIVGHPEIHFNFSHCNSAAVCAIGTQPVGIDVEDIAMQEQDVVNRTMNPEERRLITASPRPEITFTRFWTMKESVLKLTGEGLTDNLHNVLIDNQNKYLFQTFEQNNYIFTLCEYNVNSANLVD